MIGLDNKQIGIVDKHEAIRMAVEAGVDLVEVVPTAQPPICRIIDFKKFKYLEGKKEKEGKKKSKAGEMKEIRLTPFIGEHDLNVQLNKAKGFIKDKHRVKFAVRFTGRQMTKTEFGRELLVKVFENIKEIAKIDREAKMEGRQMIMTVAPI